MYKKIQTKMGSTLLILLLPALFIISLNSCSNANAQQGDIGDKHFVVTTMEVNKPETAVKEQVVFTDSLFDNLQCHEWGFNAAKYISKKADDHVTFEAEMQSANEGSMTWTGTVTGDSIYGTMVWKKVGQPNIFYTFSGATGLLPKN